MNCRNIFDRGIKFHHYCNTAYPLRPNSLAQYEIQEPGMMYEVVKNNIEAQKELCLYVHVPFCQARCKFCEYVVMDNPSDKDPDIYVEYLLKEIEMYREIIGDKPIVGYDLGGGTPSYLSIENLTKITNSIKSFNLEDGMYLSIETTPVIAANDFEKIKAIKDLGYNRISMGFQTVSEKLLESLGREGSKSIYEKAVENIRKAGFDRLNVDLMYGFLNQSDEDFANTIKYTIALGPEFITLYRNRYKGTKLEAESQGVTLYKVNRQYDIAYRLLKEAGYIANNGKNTFSKIPNDLGTSSYLTKRVVDATSYVGFGIFSSSLTESPIVSGIITFAFVFGTTWLPYMVTSLSSISLMDLFINFLFSILFFTIKYYFITKFFIIQYKFMFIFFINFIISICINYRVLFIFIIFMFYFCTTFKRSVITFIVYILNLT